ncbi:MAG: hypothetical protein KKI08_18460, partial [Armatimonadetes bacterium]|nr:hypothetical protein [Armatimonadota bacterium]
MEIPELRVRRYVRPNPATLQAAARERVLKGWDALPSPRTRPCLLEFVQLGRDVTCQLDGLYCGLAVRDGLLQSLRFAVPVGGALGETEFAPAPAPEFVPLDVRGVNQPGALAGATVTLDAAP